MAAGAFTFYNFAKKYIGDATIDLDTNTFAMSLHTSATNCADITLTAFGELNNEVASANGYSSSGKNLASLTWTVGASAKEYRWDAADLIWTASGGNIANVKFAVIRKVGASALDSFLVCFSQLSTSQFTVTTGNTLTIAPSANGIFELNG